MFPTIEVTNAFRWAGFAITISGRVYYINLSDARKLVWGKEVTKELIKDKVSETLFSSDNSFYDFFSKTQLRK